MKKYVYPSEIKGTIHAPASKSVMQRAVAAALLSPGESMIVNPSFCDDSTAAMKVAESLGASVLKRSDHVVIRGGLNPVNNVLDCGESGLCIRMFTPIVALTGKKITLTGEGSLVKRPVASIDKSLLELGVFLGSRDGCLPIEVSGKLHGGIIEIDAGLSSQNLTGLLMALPLADGDSIVNVRNLKSREYIDLTNDVLAKFGVEIDNHDYAEFRIKGNQHFNPCMVDIEGDWSGAAFLLCAGAIAGGVTVTGMNRNSFQPDRAVVAALKSCGAQIDERDCIIDVRAGTLSGFEFDATDCPDLFPPLAALALHCKGRSVITGAKRLKHKESDRGGAIVSDFRKMGGNVFLENNVMIIEGSELSGAVVDSHGDHRIAMACTIAALKVKGEVQIERAECVNKSYNKFYDDMIKLGAVIK
jgi:3-phosphoshikimate 1-carboxyvinyltransferase